MEPKLFSDSETFQKERPTEATDSQLEEFYNRMAKEIQDQGFSNSNEEDIIKDLKDLQPFSDNGFEMAKDLDGYRAEASYNIDTFFCEWLDNLSYEYDRLISKNVKEWVAAHNIQPKFPVGTKLQIQENLAYHPNLKKDNIVFITGGRPEEACYWVSEDKDRKGGYVFPYEKVEASCIEIHERTSE